jgi:hypothetical protein
MKIIGLEASIWGWPIALGIVTAIGLVGGLWGDGPWDALAWVGLGLPTAAAVWFGLRGRPPRP